MVRGNTWTQALDHYWNECSKKQKEIRKGRIPAKNSQDYHLVKKIQAKIEKGLPLQKSKVVIKTDDYGVPETEVVREKPTHQKRLLVADRRKEPKKPRKIMMPEYVKYYEQPKSSVIGPKKYTSPSQAPVPVLNPQSSIRQTHPAVTTGKEYVLVKTAKGKWMRRKPEYLLTHNIPEENIQDYISKDELTMLNQQANEDAAKAVVQGAVTRLRGKKQREQEALLKAAANTALPADGEDDEELLLLEEEGSGLRGGRKPYKPRKARTALEGYQTAADLDEYHKFFNRHHQAVIPVRAENADPEDIVFKKAREKDVETYRIKEARRKHKTVIPVPETYNSYEM
jgi:hypothetical protein